MDDGTAGEFGPWDTSVIPPGNYAGAVGNELVYAIDFTGLKDFVQKCGGIFLVSRLNYSIIFQFIMRSRMPTR
ncbi:hypothetical protein BH18THE2_BH18THE2_27440 [soil metagenome]